MTDFAKTLLSNLQCCSCGKLSLPSEAHFFEKCGHFTCISCCTPEGACSECGDIGEIVTPLTRNSRLLEAYTISLETLQLCGVYDISTQKDKKKDEIKNKGDFENKEKDESTGQKNDKLDKEEAIEEDKKRYGCKEREKECEIKEKEVTDVNKTTENKEKDGQKNDKLDKKEAIEVIEEDKKRYGCKEREKEYEIKEKEVTDVNIPRTRRSLGRSISRMQSNAIEESANANIDCIEPPQKRRISRTMTKPSDERLASKEPENKNVNLRKRGRKSIARNALADSVVSEMNIEKETTHSPVDDSGIFLHPEESVETLTDSAIIIQTDELVKKEKPKKRTVKDRNIIESGNEKPTQSLTSAAFLSDDFESLWGTFHKSCESDYSYRVPERYSRKLARTRNGKGKFTDRVNAKGETNLHRAVHQKNHEKVVELLSAGANPNVADYAGWTPLHDAIAKAKDSSIVAKLLEYGARPSAYGLDNETPLHLAVGAKNYEVMKMLLDYGADLSAPDIRGTSPRDLAANDPKAMQLLSSESKIKTTSPPRVHGQPLVLYFHRIDGHHSKIVKKFAKHFVLRETKDIYTASHIVVPSLDECSHFDWVLAQVMVKGSYICPISWCEDSMAAGKIVDAAKYHQNLSWMPGWTRARENTVRCGPGLLSGCHILLNAPNNSTQQVRDGAVKIAELRAFIKEAGGQLLTRMPDPESPYTPQTVPYHAVGSMRKCSQIVVYVPKDNDRSIKYNMEHLKCLPLQWLVDCILRFQLEPYKACPDEN